MERREGDRMLHGGEELAEVLRGLGASEPAWTRGRAQYRGMKAERRRDSSSLDVAQDR